MLKAAMRCACGPQGFCRAAFAVRCCDQGDYAELGKAAAKAEAAFNAGSKKESAMKKVVADKLDALSKSGKGFTTKNAQEVYKSYIKQTEANLEMLIKLMPEAVRKVAKLWYDGANIIANRFAENYGVTLEKAGAVLAVFSPQKDWFMNVSLGNRMMDIWTNKQNYIWDSKMSEQFRKRMGEPQPLTKKVDGQIQYVIDETLDPDDPLNPDRYVYAKGIKPVDIVDGVIVWEGFDSDKAKEQLDQAEAYIKKAEGKLSLSNLEGLEQAWFIRMYSETYHPAEYEVVGPDGSFGEMAKNNDGTSNLRIAWGGYSTILKAISVMQAEGASEQATISEALGDQHKVRSFYNNIVNPSAATSLDGRNITFGDVTMDTHAIAALLLLPLSGASREVTQNFGGGGTSSDGTEGLNGMYAANAEAYRAAAEAFGLLPREVQSITWEAVRMLFPASWKSNRKNVAQARSIWNDYLYGKTTIDEARQRIWELSPASIDPDNPSGDRIRLGDATENGRGVGIPQWWEAVVPRGTDAAGQRQASNKNWIPSIGGFVDGTGGRRGEPGGVSQRRDASGLLPESSGRVETLGEEAEDSEAPGWVEAIAKRSNNPSIADVAAVMRFGKASNFSTVIHELGHVLSILQVNIDPTNPSAGTRSVLEEMTGAKFIDLYNFATRDGRVDPSTPEGFRSYLERISEGFERFLVDGEIPVTGNKGLIDAFKIMREGMRQILLSYKSQGVPYGMNLPDDEALTDETLEAYEEILFHIGQSESRSQLPPVVLTALDVANKMHLEAIARLNESPSPVLYQSNQAVAFKQLAPMVSIAELTIQQKNGGVQPKSFDQFKAMIDPASPLATLPDGQLQLVYQAAIVSLPNPVELAIKAKVEALMAVPLTSLVADVKLATDLIQEAVDAETDPASKAKLNTILEQVDTVNNHDQLAIARGRAARAIGASAAAKSREATAKLRAMMAGYRAGKKDASIKDIADEVRKVFAVYAKAAGLRRSTRAMASQLIDGARLAQAGKISPADYLALVASAATVVQQDFANSAAIQFNRGIVAGTKATLADVKRRAGLLKQVVEAELATIKTPTKPLLKTVLKALDGVSSTRKLVKAANLIIKSFQNRRTREAYSKAKRLAAGTMKNLKKGMFGAAGSDVATLAGVKTSEIPTSLLASFLGLNSFLGQNSKSIVIDDFVLKNIRDWNDAFETYLIHNPPASRGVSAASASARIANEAMKKAQALIDYDSAKASIDRDAFVNSYMGLYGKSKEQALTALDLMEQFLPTLEKAESVDLDHMNSVSINGLISAIDAFNKGIIQSQLVQASHEIGIRETRDMLFPVLQQAVRHILTADATVNIQGLTPDEIERRSASIAGAISLFSHSGKYNKEQLREKLAKAGLSQFDSLLNTMSSMGELIVSPMTQLHFEAEIRKQRMLEAGHLYDDAKSHESETAVTPVMLAAMKKAGLLDVSIWQGTTNFMAPVAAAVGEVTSRLFPVAARAYRREAASRIIGIAAIQRQREANGWASDTAPTADDNYLLWLMSGGPGNASSEFGRREAVRQQRAAAAIIDALAGAPPTWTNIQKLLSAENIQAMDNADLVFQQTGEIVHYLNMMDENAPLEWFEKYYPIRDMSGKAEDLGPAARLASSSSMPPPSSLGVQASSRNRRTDTQLKLVDADFFGVAKSHVAQATGDAAMSPFLNRMNEAMNRMRKANDLGGTGSSIIEDIQEQLLEHGHRMAQTIFFDSDVPTSLMSVVGGKLKELPLANIFRPIFETLPSLARALGSNPMRTTNGMMRYHTASSGFPDKLMFDLKSNIALRGGSSSLDIQFANLNAAFSSMLNSDFRLPGPVSTITRSAALAAKLPTGKGLFGYLQTNYASRFNKAITQVLVTTGETIIARPFWYGTFTQSLEEQSGIPWSEDNYANGSYTQEQIKRAQALAETEVSRKFADSTPGTQPTFGLEKLEKDDGPMMAFLRYIGYAFTNYSGAQTRDFKASMKAMIEGNAGSYDRRDALANMGSIVTSYAINTILVTSVYQALAAALSSGNPDEDKRRKQRWNDYTRTLTGENGWEETRAFYLKMLARSSFSSLMGDKPFWWRVAAATALEGANYVVGKGGTWNGAYDPYKDNITFELPPSFNNAILGALPGEDRRIRGDQDTNVSTIMSAHQFLGLFSYGLEQGASAMKSAQNVYNARVEGDAVDAEASMQNLGFFALFSVNLLPVASTAFGGVRPKEIAASPAYASKNESRDQRTAEKEARTALDLGDVEVRREKMEKLGPDIADHFDKNLKKWGAAKAEMNQFDDDEKNKIMAKGLQEIIGTDNDLLNQTLTRRYRQMVDAGLGREFLRSLVRLSHAGFSAVPARTRGSEDAESLRDFEESKYSDGVSVYRDYYRQAEIMRGSLR